MRVSRSAMGSVMLIGFSRRSPAGLHEARDVAAHRGFAQLVPRETELPVNATRASGDPAATFASRRTRVPRLLLQLHLCLVALLFGRFRVADRFLQCFAFRGVLRDRLRAFLLTLDHRRLGHLNALLETES